MSEMDPYNDELSIGNYPSYQSGRSSSSQSSYNGNHPVRGGSQARPEVVIPLPQRRPEPQIPISYPIVYNNSQTHIIPSQQMSWQQVTPVVSDPYPQAQSVQWTSDWTNEQQGSRVVYAPPANGPSRQHQMPSTVVSEDQPADYRLLLLSLADQYISEARGMSTLIALRHSNSDTETYYKLLATGMRCYEMVLAKRWKLNPSRESLIQLRYATLLYEDTENDIESEALLTKGISFSEQHRLLSVKYAMQHLLARVLHRRNVKVSNKYLDGVIHNAETCQHTPWVYALRFLQISLSLHSATSQNVSIAFQHLKAISGLSKRRGDLAVHAMASALEARLHLRNPNEDSIAEAQRAIASARAQQLNKLTGLIPQLDALLHFLDLICSLDPYKPAQAKPKCQNMQSFLDQASNVGNWGTNDTFLVPVEKSPGGNLTADTGGLFVRDKDGRDSLTFTWLQKTDIYSIGYLLSAISVYSRNPSDGHKTEMFLEEGLKMTRNDYQMTDLIVAESLSQACAKSSWRTVLRCHMLAHLVFAKCERSDWTAAQETLNSLRGVVSTTGVSVPESLICLVSYLEGVISQGIGNLDAALRAYRSPLLSLPNPSICLTSTFQLSLSLLAALNAFLIIRNPQHPQNNLTGSLLDQLFPYFDSSGPARDLLNPHLAAAHSFILSTLAHSSSQLRPDSNTTKPTTTILTTKQHLQRALSLAKSVSNSQLLAFSLSLMCESFFDGIVGDQAVQAATAARHTSKESGSRLWIAVADGMLEKTLEKSGKTVEAERPRSEWQSIVSSGGVPAVMAGNTKNHK